MQRRETKLKRRISSCTAGPTRSLPGCLRRQPFRPGHSVEPVLLLGFHVYLCRKPVAGQRLVDVLFYARSEGGGDGYDSCLGFGVTL